MDAGLAYLPVWLRPWPTWAAGALFVVAAAALSSLGAGGHAPGSGALFTVTDCATYGDATRAGTLAYELALENSGPSPVGDTITFDCGAAPVTIAVPATIVISHDLTISGGSSQVTLSGSDTVRVFSVSTGAHLSLSRLTIAHGRGAGISVGEGGAILNAGTLTVSECIFEANVADGANGDGGAVSNEGGSVTVTDTTFANNTAHGVEAVGGALYSHGGIVTISASTFSGNTAAGDGHAFGGGVGNAGGAATITNSTFSGNVAAGPGPTTAEVSFGGGLNNLDGSTVLVNDTFAGNAAQGPHGGGNIYFNNGQFSLTNTLLAASLHTTNCGGAYPLIADGGYNLTDNGAAGCNLSAGRHDVVDVADPGLGSLGDNGGPTETIALLPGSPAVGAASSSACPAVDQRGVSRRGTTCDIGAFQLVLPATATLEDSPTPAQYGQTVTLTARVTAAGGPGAPTGIVTFMDGATTLGTSALSGGEAVLATSALAPGRHQITAHYEGDGRFAPASSIPVVQMVYELLGTASPTVASTITGATPAHQQIALTIPAGAVDTAVTVTGNPPDTTPPPPAGDTLVGPTLLLAAADAAGHATSALNQPGMLTLSYDPGALTATDAYRLVVAEYDGPGGSWVTLDTRLDTTLHTVSASFSAFGTYSVLEVPALPPTTVADLSATPTAYGWLNRAVTVTLSASGGTGGVGDTYYSVDDASCVPTALASCSSYTAPFAVTSSGAHTVYFFSVARAGAAESQRSIAVRLDFQAPSTHLAIGSPHVAGGSVFVTSATPLTLTGDDGSGGSGVQAVMYCVFKTGGTCAYVPASGLFTIAGPDGRYEVDYYGTDKAGNAEAAHRQLVTLDTTAPSSTLTPDASTVTDATVFHVAATDAGAGVASFAYRFYASGSASPTFTVDSGSTAHFTLSGNPNGDYVIEWFATDALGNVQPTQRRTVTLANPTTGGQVPATPTPAATVTPTPTPTAEATDIATPTSTSSGTGGGGTTTSPPAAGPPAGGASGVPGGWVLGGIAVLLLVLLGGVVSVILARWRGDESAGRG